MDYERFLECLTADAGRLRAVVAGHGLAARVPTCPDWTVTDLVRHVGAVYLHKVACMRDNARPDPWPPAGMESAEPLGLFDRGWAELSGELTQRKPAEPAFSWYTPDQTVGFWGRRMAHETVIHRVDAELAAGESIAPIPADLAADGIDEVLTTFLSWGSQVYPEEFGDLLTRCTGESVLIATGGAQWLVHLDPTGVRVGPGADGQPVAQVSGDAAAVLLWLWRRAGDDAIRVDGDTAAVDTLRELLGAATQ